MAHSLLKEKIAIVGIGCHFPDAPDPDIYWNNILDKKVSIGPVDQKVFDKKVHFDPSVYGKTDKNDKTYTEIGSHTVNLDFNGMRFRIPPSVAKHMDDNQKLIVLATEQALSMVNWKNWNRDKVSVFIATSLGGQLHHNFHRRTIYDRFEYHLKNHPEFKSLTNLQQEQILSDLCREIKSGTFSVTEDSAPGILPSIIAARVASVFDFHGHAYTIDAACASVIAATINGIQHLNSGESDVILCGGADMLNGELGRVYFSGINALSPNGSFPFDIRANGFVIGEGGGVLILKRLSDAIRDNDTILATIAGYGQNSDGKGKSIAAPNSRWQAMAIQQAIEMGGVQPDTIELIEAHGTSTVVGDKSEIEALKISFKALGAQKKNFCAVGSAKSNIGHLKSAAGIAGLIKAIQAIRYKILPPSANCENVNPNLGIEDSPFYINTESREWLPSSHPRRAGVSAFGFGGANYHILLEEFRKEFHTPNVSLMQYQSTGMQYHALWLSANNREELHSRLDAVSSEIGDSDSIDYDKITELNYIANNNDPYRLAFCCTSSADLKCKVQLYKSNASGNNALNLKTKGIFYKTSVPVTTEQTAFLFPGQSSQYPDMTLKLQKLYPSILQITKPMDLYWQKNAGSKIHDLIDSGIRGKDNTVSLLKNTRNTHPALLYSCLSIYKVLDNMGVKARYMVGHSAGEIIALAAARVITLDDALMLMNERSRSFTDMNVDDFGKMIAVSVDPETLQNLICESGEEVTLANINSPKQIIVSGKSRAIDSFCTFLKGKNVYYVELKVSHAFHSPVVEQASVQFSKILEKVQFASTDNTVFANEICREYPNDSDGIRAVLQRQITAPVYYMGSIASLYEKGVRLFIEVGPNTILSQLTHAILEGKEHAVISTNVKNGDDAESIQMALAAMFAEGVNINYIPPSPIHGGKSSSVGILKEDVALQPEHSSQTGYSQKQSMPAQRRRIVYSGVSVGLPGSFRKSFQDDNFDQLFEGHNFIERLTEKEKERLVELQVTKVLKTSQGPIFQLLDSLQDVIQLAGKLGKIDPVADYGFDPKEIKQMSAAIQHGIAAGYEALRDSHIPLVCQYIKTASGGLLPDRWALPQAMQKRTGVIFAYSFPMVEMVIAEVSRHISFKYGCKLRGEILCFYESLLSKVKDSEAKKLLTDWFVLNHNRLSEAPSEGELFHFNHHFINQISCLANNRIAQFIQALGPNFQINAACSSTSTAITLSEEMIQSGRVDRMLIIASDEATSEISMPYLGAGFLSTGAATCEADLYKAAIPFDQRRNGMIMSSGAIAIVVESLAEVQNRGVTPVCELLGSHVFNTGGHHARLDIPKYADQLDDFISRMEKMYNFSRMDIASKLLYVSHETYTPARGGCSEAEAFSLKQTFGTQYSQIEVTNTKGMTGHTMGTSIEDVVAARALQLGKIPPIVNYKVPDPNLKGLKLSKGGSHNCDYALRMSAGFGSQGNYILLKKYATSSDSRIADNVKYQHWIDEISGHKQAALEIAGRVLRVIDKNSSAGADTRTSSSVANIPDVPGKIDKISSETVSEKNTDSREVLKVIAEITGYPPEMIEADMEIETDLGIDTVKQATILAALSERFGMDEKIDFQISAYPTVGHWVALFIGDSLSTQPVQSIGLPSTSNLTPAPITGDNRTKEVFQVISEITGYPPEMIEADMEIETDLGIDTVKQATILATLSERFGMDEKIDFQISAYPTVGHWVALFTGDSLSTQPVQSIGLPSTSNLTPAPITGDNRTKEVFQVISEITGYPPEMIEADMEIETDLGIDTVKQATILATLSEQFGMDEKIDFQISAYPTVGHWVALFTGDSLSTQPVQSIDLPSTSKLTPAPITGDNRTKEVFQVISEITGYPPEMIEADMEIETDLGIDTVKQATILGKLTERFGIIEDIDFQLSAYPTVGHWIELFNNVEICKPSNAFNLQSHILEFQKCDLSPGLIDLSGLSLWLLGKEDTEVKRAVAHFKPLCKSVVCIDITSDMVHEECADIWIDTGILQASIPAQLSVANCKNVVQELLATRFDFCKNWSDTSKKRPQRILLCRTPQLYAWNNLLQGFYQSIAKEWNMRFSSLEFKNATSQNSYWTSVENEIRSHSDGIRILIDNNVRFAHTLIEKKLPSQNSKSIPWSETDIILITGGGVGITARIACEIASNLPAKLVIIGKTELSDNDYTSEYWSDGFLDKRKAELKDQIAKTGKRVTPALLENELTIALKQRELQFTLKNIRKMGREVLYMNCDITDSVNLKKCINMINSNWGDITGILHGAGLEKSQLFSKKSRKEFFTIIDTKVLGALNLYDLCSIDKVKLWSSFSSISGIFGNEAQTDYSAANAFLQGFADDLSCKHQGIHSVSIAWSGWSEVGMAWRNTFVRENAESIGLHLIPPSVGCKSAIDILTKPDAICTYIVHGGLGKMITRDWQVSKFETPLIDRFEYLENNVLRAYRTISCKTDEWINQHRLADVPLAPGVGMIELMAETFARTHKIDSGLKFENVSFHDAFKLYEGKPRELYIQSSGIHTDTQTMRVFSEFKSRLVTTPQIRDYSAAKVSSISSAPPLFDIHKWNLENATRSFYESILDNLHSIPRNVIFGPLFHDSKRDGYKQNTDWVEWTSEILHTMHSFPLEQLINPKYQLDKYIFNFCLLDSIHQTGVIHTIVTTGDVYLPLSAREFSIFGKQVTPGQYQTFAKLMEKSEAKAVYDIYLLDPQGTVCAYALGSTYHRIQK